jgi:hypothetical protein
MRRAACPFTRPLAPPGFRLAQGTRWIIPCALSLMLTSSLGAVSPSRQTAPERIVAIGDLHGDATAFRAILRHAKLLDDQDRWIAGTTTLVQTGDYFDRGSEVRELLDLLRSLETSAAAAGGKVIVLLGNHEGMNLIGETRDVSPDAFRGFADGQSETRRQAAFDDHRKLASARRAALERSDPPLQVPAIYAAPDRDAWMAAHPPGMLEYLEAIGSSGRYGAWLRARPATARLGGTVFVHGGFDPEIVPKTLDAANDQVSKEIQRFDRMRKYMIDRTLALPSFTFGELLEAGRTELVRAAAEARAQGEPAAPGVLPPAIVRHPLAGLLDIDNWALVNARGPLWFRGFANWTDAEGTPLVTSLASRFAADRFVVGHTVTKTFRITPRFDNRVILIDTGISGVYRANGGQPSALEIQGDALTAIYATERVELATPALRP